MQRERDYFKQLIPKGPYCYDEDGTCPFWEYKTYMNAYCHFEKVDDNELERRDGFSSHLWDQCKICGVNEE